MKKHVRPTVTAAWAASLLISGGLALAGCGDDDPLGDKCNAVCQVPQDHPCANGNFVSRCVADCKALAGDAASKGYKKEHDFGWWKDAKVVYALNNTLKKGGEHKNS